MNLPLRDSASCLSLSLSLALPQAYRVRDFWGFHRRDAQQCAERVEGSSLYKGLMWQGQPTLLSLHLPPDPPVAGADSPAMVQACWQWLEASPPQDPVAHRQAQLLSMVQRMLGLGQQVQVFEDRWQSHARLGPLLVSQRGLHVPATCTPWEALSWAVTGQQISVAAAVSLRRKYIVAAGQRWGDGPDSLWCTPEPAQVAQLSPEILRAAGFSQGKAQSLLALARAVQDRGLPLDEWARCEPLPVQDISERLLAIKGVGPWTVNYALLRGYGHLDGSLHGDVAVRRALALLLGRDAVGAAEAEQWLAAFSPWRALVAAHLWASLSATGF